MSQRSWIMGLSLVAHAALAVGINKIEAKTFHEATAIEIAEVAPPPPPPPTPIENKPAPEPKTQATRKVAAAAPAPAEAPPETPQLGAALPDFGLSLSGGVGGEGIALPAAAAAAPRAAAPVVKRELTAQPADVPVTGCNEQASKPKPKNVPQPAYTAAASAAAVEGKVRLSLTVDEQGNVVDVKVLQGLGYGLDEAALDAARQATFDPALACGKPVRATFTISMRFSAG